MKDRLAGLLRRWRSAAAPKPPQRFVVLAMQRTGSTMVVSALNSHPDIFCYRELFRRDPAATAGLPDAIDSRFHDPDYRHAHPEAYLEAIYGIRHDAGFVGFKLLLSQHREIRDRLIEDQRYRKILLRRDNLLARYASERLLTATRACTVEKDGKVTFIERDFLKYRRYYRRFHDDTLGRLERTGQPFLAIPYVKVCTAAGLHQVLAAIGADSSVSLRFATTKGGSTDIVSRFSNHADVEDFLGRNQLEHWRFEEMM